MTTKITEIKAREVLDSRGNPTVEVDLFVDDVIGRFIVPSGASTGEFEAVELRDQDDRYHGKGVKQAINNIEYKIRPELIGVDVTDHQQIDKIMLELDGTDNKSKLGANAILGVSIAAVKAGAKVENQSLFQHIGDNQRLPCPMLNVINGGEHAGGNLAIQEFMLLPYGFDNFKFALQASSEVYHSLKGYLEEHYGAFSVNVGDEGGFVPPIDTSSEAINTLLKAIEEAGYGKNEFQLGLDAAASEFYENGKYMIDNKELTPSEMIDYYNNLFSTYPSLQSVEDPFNENDFESFANLVESNPNRAIVGDDLTVTNVDRIETAIEHQSMNYLLLKVNQIGTYTEAKNAFDLTKDQDWGVVISHRSGETEDTFIADLSVGWGAERIKTGAPARSERVAKYNRLLRIQEILGDNALYFNK